jgi:hypothetical protein
LSTSFKNQTITTTERDKMKKALLALLSAVLLITVTQPAQAEDQKVLAIIDSAINSKNFNAIIHEVCFTTTGAVPNKMACPNGQTFMEGPGSASAPWPTSINSTTFHGDAMVKAALATNPNVKIVFVRSADITLSGNTLGSQTPALAAAIDWVSKNSAKYSIDAVSISQASISKNNLDACTGAGTFANDGARTINAVSLLSALNIPVFAATGNDRSSTVVGFPACVPGVIGVGALHSLTVFERVTNTGPGLDIVALGKVTITKYGRTEPTDISGTSAATVVSASSYVGKNTNKTFADYISLLPKVVLSGVSYSYASK